MLQKIEKAATTFRAAFNMESVLQSDYSALVTCPERMQRVQTLMLCTVPFRNALIFCRLGYQVFAVLLWAWLTLLPKLGPLPHIAHILAISSSPSE